MITAVDIGRLWQHSNAIRRNAPLIHNITNLVMQNDTADVIAAMGGTQMTLHTREEAHAAASIADALAINSGTLDEAWLECAHEAIYAILTRGRPWILDPVAAGLSDYRTQSIFKLLQLGPTIIKANASEILVLAGSQEAGRAADAIHSVDYAAAAADKLAREHGCVVVVTGSEDLVTDGERRVRMANGHAMMSRMIGSGCMLTSVVGCFLAVIEAPFEAALAAVAYFTVAGEIAAEQAGGPGTLKPLLIDNLYSLNGEMLGERLRIRHSQAGY